MVLLSILICSVAASVAASVGGRLGASLGTSLAAGVTSLVGTLPPFVGAVLTWGSLLLSVSPSLFLLSVLAAIEKANKKVRNRRTSFTRFVYIIGV